MINIVLCPSDNYTMPCGVTICSVCENNRNTPITFYVLIDSSFTEKHKQQLRDLISKYNQKTIVFIHVKDEKIDLFLQLENSWWTRHIFYRLLTDQLLPQSVSIALYLDCDIIVRHSLEELWKIDLTGKSIGCVPDSMEGLIEFYNRLGYVSEKGYFNSGVLLMNLGYWREHHISEIFSEYIKTHSKQLKHPDQDVLNVIFKDSKILLPLTYNFQSGFIFKEKFLTLDYTKYKDEIEIASKDPIILHFSGVRPWMSNHRKHPYIEEFFKYKRLTQWKDDPLWSDNRPFKLKMINKFRPFLSKLGLCHVVEDPFDQRFKLQ